MSIKFIILGALMEGDKHPYEIQQLIWEREMDKYVKFQKGSLYYAVNSMEKGGLIEIVDVISDKKRPDKTVYRITATGRAVFQEMLLEESYNEHKNKISKSNMYIMLMTIEQLKAQLKCVRALRQDALDNRLGENETPVL